MIFFFMKFQGNTLLNCFLLSNFEDNSNTFLEYFGYSLAATNLKKEFTDFEIPYILVCFKPLIILKVTFAPPPLCHNIFFVFTLLSPPLSCKIYFQLTKPPKSDFILKGELHFHLPSLICHYQPSCVGVIHQFTSLPAGGWPVIYVCVITHRTESLRPFCKNNCNNLFFFSICLKMLKQKLACLEEKISPCHTNHFLPDTPSVLPLIWTIFFCPPPPPFPLS